jgi:hypothetical protein
MASRKPRRTRAVAPAAAHERRMREHWRRAGKSEYEARSLARQARRNFERLAARREAERAARRRQHRTLEEKLARASSRVQDIYAYYRRRGYAPEAAYRIAQGTLYRAGVRKWGKAAMADRIDAGRPRRRRDHG